jgi:GntR family transcriptional regulator, transcriptional repressor for pyruvate dehydrogenase complex
LTDGVDDLLARIIEIAVRTRPDASGRIRLPTERDLSEQLNVQRPTLRERLTVLETLGFIHRQQGSGTYLTLPNSKFLQFYFEVARKLGFLQLGEIQRAMEMIGLEMASTAAIQARAEDFAAMERVLAKLEASDGVEALVDGQFEFHACLARACHNPVLVIIIDALASVIRSVIAQRLGVLAMVKGAFARNVDAYVSLVDALKEREPELARSALQECYALWRREESKISLLYVQE